MTMLSAVLYTSPCRFPATAAEFESHYRFEALLRREMGITGVTLFADGNVMQYMEGEETPLRNVYAATLARTHGAPLELLHESIQRRLFCDWIMAVYDTSDIAGELAESTGRWQALYAAAVPPLSETTPFAVLSSFWDSWSRWTPRPAWRSGQMHSVPA